MTTQVNEIETSKIEQKERKFDKWLKSFDAKSVLFPFLGIVVFLMIWSISAERIDTSLGKFPGPTQVYSQALVLVDEHNAERVKADAFYERQEARNAKKLQKNPDAKIKVRSYTGKETFFDQILTSLKTVMFGFIIASGIAIPLGVVCGLSDGVYKGMNPLIQIFKPVSPLAWLPLITMVVSAVYVSEDPYFEKSGANSCAKNNFACFSTNDFYRAAFVLSDWLDGINCSRNALAKPWFRKVCVG